LLAKGLALSARGESARAQAAAAEAIRLAREREMGPSAIRGLIDLGNQHFLRGERRQAELYFREGLALAQRIHAPYPEARVRVSLASLLTQYSEASNASEILVPARLYFPAAGMVREAVQVELLMGRIQEQSGEYLQAEKAYRKALESSRATGDIEQEALAHSSLAGLYFLLGRLPDALKENEAVVEGAGAVRGGLRLVRGRIALARVQNALGRFPQAAATLEAAARDVERLPGDQQVTRARLAVANAELHYLRGDWQKALAYATRVEQNSVRSFEQSEAAMFACLSKFRLRRLVSSACKQIANQAADRVLAAQAELQLAEALADTNRNREAYELSESAARFFASRTMPEALWRSQVLAGSTAAEQTLRRLVLDWPTDVKNSYLARRDVIALVGAMTPRPAVPRMNGQKQLNTRQE
jgi:tetratricopeptide (TPR) repeat protein